MRASGPGGTSEGKKSEPGFNPNNTSRLPRAGSVNESPPGFMNTILQPSRANQSGSTVSSLILPSKEYRLLTQKLTRTE